MSDENIFKQHPIQLRSVKVLELTLKVKLANQQQELPEEGSFNLGSGYSEYHKDDQTISVKIGAHVDEEESPFDLCVELMGVFIVDESSFPIEYIHDWAKKNAPLILYPYLREQVYSLTSKAGFDGTLLPLFEVPTFRIENKPNEIQTH